MHVPNINKINIINKKLDVFYVNWYTSLSMSKTTLYCNITERGLVYAVSIEDNQNLPRMN